MYFCEELASTYILIVFFSPFSFTHFDTFQKSVAFFFFFLKAQSFTLFTLYVTYAQTSEIKRVKQKELFFFLPL